jgi:hypothetical protein
MGCPGASAAGKGYLGALAIGDGHNVVTKALRFIRH